MDVAKIPIGRKPPDDVNVIVEIPQGGEPVKYELDKEKAPADPCPCSKNLSCTKTCPVWESVCRAHDLLDRPVLLKIGPPYLANHVHANRPHKSFPTDQGQREGR
jgi:hypothetical protein